MKMKPLSLNTIAEITGGEFYKNGDFITSNKYFSKAMLLANQNSSEYKLAKSRVVDV